MEDKLSYLRKILDESRYTVAICGSGMLEEGGYLGVKKPDRAYDIEEKYGASPEDIFSSAFYNTRADKFFDFYKNEMLKHCPQRTASGDALAAMERAGKLQCVITSNIYEHAQQAGCKNVINLHGSIYENRCPHCGKNYSMEYVRDSKRVPICEKCNVPIRPMVSLFGEMVDSQLMTRTTLEIEKADVLLLLGTTLESDVFANYIRYFDGRFIIIIHQREHYMDYKADIVFIEQPANILPRLGY